MNEKLKKVISEALKETSEESFREGIIASAVSLLLGGDKNLGFYLTVCDLNDPSGEKARQTVFCGEPVKLAAALGMEMIDNDEARYILNNAKGLLDLFNQDLPEGEKLK